MEKYGTARQDTDDNVTRRMRFACWITTATDTHSQCVTLIAFLEQWLCERSTMLRYMYIAFPVSLGGGGGHSNFILAFRGPCIMIFSYNRSQRDALFLKLI